MDDTVQTRSGKQIFGVVIFVAVIMGGGLGLMIGGSPEIEHMTVLSIIRLHPTPKSMALYGMTVTAVSLSLFFGLVVALTRLDQSEM